MTVNDPFSNAISDEWVSTCSNCSVSRRSGLTQFPARLPLLRKPTVWASFNILPSGPTLAVGAAGKASRRDVEIWDNFQLPQRGKGVRFPHVRFRLEANGPSPAGRIGKSSDGIKISSSSFSGLDFREPKTARSIGAGVWGRLQLGRKFMLLSWMLSTSLQTAVIIGQDCGIGHAFPTGR